jgi:hypothetical protein
VGQRIRVNLRDANRDRNRDLHHHALKPAEGQSYLMLLEPREVKKVKPAPAFDLARGVEGLRELPAEGRAALLDAVERFVQVQDLEDDRVIWDRLASMLEETHPILLQTALDQFLKFRRGEAGLVESLRPLLDHPSYQVRERTARLIGQIVSREPDREIADVDLLRNELVARARRDGNVGVRLAATEALGNFEDDSVLEILEEIAERDPDQNVRYEAEKMAYERAQRQHYPGAAGRPDSRN